MMFATQLNPNHPYHYFPASPVRARERQIRAPKKRIFGGLSIRPYSDRVTVYPYNGYIRGTNPIVQRVMSLTCTLRRMRANQRAPKHAATQPLHDSSRVHPGRGSSSNFWLKLETVLTGGKEMLCYPLKHEVGIFLTTDI